MVSFVTDTQKRKIDEILERINEVYNEASSLSDELHKDCNLMEKYLDDFKRR